MIGLMATPFLLMKNESIYPIAKKKRYDGQKFHSHICTSTVIYSPRGMWHSRNRTCSFVSFLNVGFNAATLCNSASYPCDSILK